MANFGQFFENHGFLVLTPLEKKWKNGNFSKTMDYPLSTSCFYSLEMRFFVLEYHKTHFFGLYKNHKFWTKPWFNPFGKMSFFDVFNFLFLSLEMRFLGIS